jgi:hypothetical protein
MRSSPPNARPTRPEASVLRHLSIGRAVRTATVSIALVALMSPNIHAGAAGAATATTKKSAPAKVVKSPLPVMSVTDVKTGKQVALASTFDGTKPMLVWFWAPH